MAGKWKDRLSDQLCQAILTLKDVEEAYRFLEDLATIGEVRALAQRLEVSRLLSEGFTYPQIAQQTGASTATISRVKNSWNTELTGTSSSSHDSNPKNDPSTRAGYSPIPASPGTRAETTYPTGRAG